MPEALTNFSQCCGWVGLAPLCFWPGLNCCLSWQPVGWVYNYLNASTIIRMVGCCHLGPGLWLWLWLGLGLRAEQQSGQEKDGKVRGV